MSSYKTTRVSNRWIAGSLALAVLVILTSGWLVSCTSTLDGDQTANQKPNVFFVNIPPEGQQFSRNPTVYWFGSDPDGLIDFYRYHVATKAVVDAAPYNGDAQAYIQSVSADQWVVNDVDPQVADPQTEQSVPLRADPDSPVLTFVDQYVFIQAFDEEGLGSDIEYRLFSRNNNPPQTLINGFSPFLPFVNAEQAGGAITGIRLSWQGSDEIDWPSDPPPFQFEWRLYGPYNRAEYDSVTNKYFTEILQTSDGRLFRFGDTLELCDTNLVNDSLVISCTSYVVDAGIEGDLPIGFASLEPYFPVNDSAFMNDSLNRLVSSSADDPAAVDGSWVMSTADTLFDVFRFDPNDTTVQKNFVFWVRSRDDALTPDLVPAFTHRDTVKVIDPKFERDVLMVDYVGSTPPGVFISARGSDAKTYWGEWIREWQQSRTSNPLPDGSPFLWDGTDSVDFIDRKNQQAELPLRLLLQHKIVLLLNDATMSKSNVENATNNLFKAIDGGVNAWMAMRCVFEPQGGGIQGRFSQTEVATVKGGFDFINYFGVTRTTFSGWGCSAAAGVGFPGVDPADCPGGRIEDFIGTYSLLEGLYPPLTVDTGYLHNRYSWVAPANNVIAQAYSWWPDADTTGEPIGALPEVGWSSRVTPGTEIIYLYKSLYGNNHPNGFEYSFEGSPVAHRYDRGTFRTAYFNFTPVAFPDADAQTIVNSTLDFLFDADLATPPTSVRYPEAPTKATVEQLADNYTRRVMENANPDDFAPIQYEGQFRQKALQEMYRNR